MKRIFILILILSATNLHAHGGVETLHSGAPCKADQGKILGDSQEVLEKVVDKAVSVLTAEEFYKKFKMVKGLRIKGSANIDSDSLGSAADIIEKMISKRADIKKRLIDEKADVVIIAKNENYCDIPEARDLKDVKTFDGRSFCDICGGGGVIGRPITTVCEDNLLKTDKDPYHGTEDILTHEFAHTMHIMGMSEDDKKMVTKLYEEAKAKGIFEKNAEGKSTYMMANEQEFFACLSAAWFGVHNPLSPAISPELVNRESIKIKLPAVYEFMRTVYPE